MAKPTRKLKRLRSPFNTKEAKDYADRTNREIRESRKQERLKKSIPGFKKGSVRITKRGLKKLMEIQRSINQYHCTGGVIIPKSDCCNATITHTKGGVIMEICSKCGKTIHEKRYK